ncbi:reticulon-3-like [Pleurodeles waltl]|uniref:reticulon-3-like n=1 Tax=Pleurodeles waltl TaxID=8319 RepID=UPI0037097143
MAENATQSTHISSSHGADGSCKAGSCSGPCAELKATSFPEGCTESTQNMPAVDVGVEAAPRKTPDEAEMLFTSPNLHSYNPFVTSEFVGNIQPMREVAVSSAGDGQLGLHGDEKESGDVAIAASAAGLKFLMLSEQEPPTKSFQKEDGLLQHCSPATVLGNSTPEIESPCSPFEVLVGKTEFAHSSGQASANQDQDGKYVEAEWLTKSWSSGAYGKSGTAVSGSLPSGPPSYESVARQDMGFHSFQGLSSDMLDWNMSKGLKVSAEASHKCNDTSTGFQGVALCNLSPETIEKIPQFQKDEQCPVNKLTGTPEEITFVHSSQRNRGETKKAELLDVKSWKDDEQNLVNLQAIGNTPTGLASSTSEEVAPLKCFLDSFQLSADSAWPDSAENADSSGESDDTVIEDTKAVLALAGKKEAAKIEALKVVVDPSQGEQIVSPPFTLVLVPGQEIDAEYSPEELAYHEKSKLPYAIPEEDVDFIDDFETIQAPADSVESEDRLQKELSNQEVKKLKTPYKFESQVSKTSPSELVLKDVSQSVQESEPFFLSFDKTTVSSEHQDSMGGESYMDFMKPLGTESMEFLETQSQIKEGSEDGEPTKAYTVKAAASRKLPLSERKEDDYCIFAQAGVTAGGASSHGTKLQPSPASPEATKFFLDLDQEQLTIAALRELNTIPDESPVSAEESRSPSPKEEPSFLSSNQMAAAYICSQEYISHARPIETIEEETDVVPAESSSKLAKDSGLLTRGSARDLVFWRDVKKSGVVFGTSLVLLLSLAAFSIISVVAYLILALLSVTISFRVYRSVIQAVQKSEEGHPFKPWLDLDISVSSEAFHNYMNTSLVYVNKALKKIIRLFLVEDLVDSLKMAVLMWLMTYVGAVFNGITLLILGLLLAFTVPVIYEKYQTQIDHYVSIIRDQSKAIIAKVHAKLPGLAKKKAE